MIGKTYTAAVMGVYASPILVEADISPGIPYFEITGNISTIVREGRERVRSALRNSDIRLNPSKVVINLAPANVRKNGTHFDLAVAIAVLSSIGLVNTDKAKEIMFIGELALDGKVNTVNAILPMVICAKENGIKKCIVPHGNEKEGSCIPNIEVIPVKSLKECVDYLSGRVDIAITKDNSKETEQTVPDFSEVYGQSALKRATMVAAASLHNMMIFGPPGAGKTMTAMRIPGILPPLSFEECLEISRTYSVAGFLNNDRYMITKRPFRNPPYTITKAAFAGGGTSPMPGELSLAESGVLFLDELNLFSKDVCETLRMPLEDKKIQVNRKRGECCFNADFMLVAAMNPCACGYYPDRTRCKCSELEIKRHYGKLSKPILDRIDIYVQAPRLEYEDVTHGKNDIYSTDYMRQKVNQAMNIQRERFKGCCYSLNSHIPAEKVKYYCNLEKDTESVIKAVYDKYDLSARAYSKILRVARTIADIEGHENIEIGDISEATSYRASGVMNA